MFAPTKIWRRWHRHINVSQKRYAICSAIASTGIPSIVMSKGGFDTSAVIIVSCVDRKHDCPGVASLDGGESSSR